MYQFCQSPKLSVIFESINAIIDIFSEDDHNKVLKSANFIGTFKPKLKMLESKLAAEKN